MIQFARTSNDLARLRIGLSGAVPEPERWAGRAMDYEILELIATVSDGVFRHGGTLVHGSHPSFTPRILFQARPYRRRPLQPVVRFYLSDLFRDAGLPELIERYDCTELITVPKAGSGSADAIRNASLERMRRLLIDNIDVLVIVGGKFHAGNGKRAGTMEELHLARDKEIPCFLLGGLGGKSSELINDYASGRLGNGLSPELNHDLMTTADLSHAAGIIVSALREQATLLHRKENKQSGTELGSG